MILGRKQISYRQHSLELILKQEVSGWLSVTTTTKLFFGSCLPDEHGIR
jgi:hypothetical protein